MATHPVIRALHDVGLAAWTGGSLMGAVGLNGAVAELPDPAERTRASTAGWTRWAPVSGAALGAHLVGATGLLVTNLSRVRHQEGVLRSSVIKTGVTGAAVGLAAYSGVLNRRMAAAGPVPAAGATSPSAATPAPVASTQRQLRVVQWLDPAVGFALIGLSAWQSQQQRTAEQTRGLLAGLAGGRLPLVAGLGGAAALAALTLRGSRSAGPVEEPGPVADPVAVADPGAVADPDPFAVADPVVVDVVVEETVVVVDLDADPELDPTRPSPGVP